RNRIALYPATTRVLIEIHARVDAFVHGLDIKARRVRQCRDGFIYRCGTDVAGIGARRRRLLRLRRQSAGKQKDRDQQGSTRSHWWHGFRAATVAAGTPPVYMTASTRAKDPRSYAAFL